MKEIIIEEMRSSEIDEVAEILTDAFETNSAYSLIFKKDAQLKEGLYWLFKTSLVLNNCKRTLTYVMKEKETGKIVGAYSIVPPRGVKTGISIYFKIGLPGFISKFGMDSFIRMLGLNSANKMTLAQSIGVPEYYYLSMVVIRKEYRGTGIGSQAVKKTIQKLAASKPICNVMGLTTQLPENVTFYTRLGFEKLNEGYVYYKGDKYYNYNLKLNIPI